MGSLLILDHPPQQHKHGGKSDYIRSHFIESFAADFYQGCLLP
jgi:hypothetical protein